MPPLSEDKLYPKEQALVDLVAAERLAGRKVLVYATHTGTRDITERMEQFLTTHGFRVAVLKADTVAPDRREAWVEERVKQGVDVVICHPRLVQTGLDLIDFPTLVWFETDYSVYVMRQASRRSWRIGQKRPVKVIYMAYRNTLQADALKLVAKKLQSSLAVEGELPEDGLAAFGDDGDDLMLALARQIVNGKETEGDSESVEQVFAQARDAEASAEEFLVGRRLESGGGPSRSLRRWPLGSTATDTTTPSSLRQRSSWFRPTATTANGNGNGHHEEPAEGQQSLFSWAEFMAEEPVKPRGRNGKAKPAAASLFEWALNAEQEREAEPVGTGS